MKYEDSQVVLAILQDEASLDVRSDRRVVRLDLAHGSAEGDVIYHGFILRGHLADGNPAGMAERIEEAVNDLWDDVLDMERVTESPIEVIELYDFEREGTGGYVVAVRAPYRLKRPNTALSAFPNSAAGHGGGGHW